MARKLFEKQGIRVRSGALATGTVYVVYTDSAGTTLADISETSGGSAIAGSTVTVTDRAGLGLATLLFYGPTDGTDTLYLRCPADTSLGVQEIEADEDERLDALVAASGIPPAIFDAKGDIVAASAADTAARLAAGANDTVLTADSTTGTGLKWAAPAAHPNLAAHDSLGLATDAELTTHAGAGDPHTGYVLESLYDAKGDLLAASADNTPAKVTVGTNGFRLAADSTQTPGVKWVAPASADAALLNGGNAFREPYDRHLGGNNLAALLTSGQALAVAVPCYAGDVITSIAFVAGATGLTMGSNVDGHLWFALYDPSLNLLSQSADQGGAATWAIAATKDLALGAPQTLATTGVYYAVVMVHAGTGGSPAVPTLRGIALNLLPIINGPVSGQKTLSGTSGSGLGATAGASLTLTGASGCPYCVLH